MNRIWIAGILLALGGLERASAQEASSAGLSVTADVTFASRYMIGGFSVGGDDAVLQPSVEVGLFNTGISLLAWSSLPLDRTQRQFDELDLMARYSGDFFRGQWYAANLHGFFDYWTFPRNQFSTFDGAGAVVFQNKQGNKIQAGVSLPELLPLAGSRLVPTYNFNYWLYWAENRNDLFQGGAHHELMLHYYHAIPAFVPGSVGQYLGVSGSMNYHGGAFGVRPGWTHATAQLSTGVYALRGLFSLSYNHQWASADHPDFGGAAWSTLSFTKTF